MKNISFTIQDSLGIHARPAGLLTKLCQEFSSSVIIKCKDKEADAKKLIRVMTLGAKQGDVLDITVDGSDEEEATAKLVSFLEENL